MRVEDVRDWQTVQAEQKHLQMEVDLVGWALLDFHFICAKEIRVTFVDSDGEIVGPVYVGREVKFRYRVKGVALVDVEVPKGELLSYRGSVSGPRRIFDRVGDRPARIHRQTPVGPDVPRALKDYVDARFAALGVETEDVLEDVEGDLDFDESDDFAYLGEGHMETPAQMDLEEAIDAAEPKAVSPSPPSSPPTEPAPERDDGDSA